MLAQIARLDQILRVAKTRLVRGAGVAFVAQTGGLVLNYALNVLLARFLGAEQYGAYVFALGWLSVLAIPSTLGFTTSVIKLVPEYISDGSLGLLNGVLRFSTKVALAGGLAFAAISVLTYVGITYVWGRDVDAVLLIAFASIPILGFSHLEAGKLRGLKHIGKSVLPLRVVRPGAMLVLIVFLGIWGLEIGADEAMLLHGLVLVGVVVAYRGLTSGALPEESRTVPVQTASRSWIRISLPLMLVAAFSLLLANTDIIMVGLLSEVEQVAFYNAAARTSSVIGFALLAVNAIAAPLVAEFFATKSRRELQVLINKTSVLILAMTVPLAIVILTYSGLILSLFGETFQQARSVLIILAGGQIINAVAGSVGVVLDMTGYGNDTARVFGSSVLVNIVLNLILVPGYGATGAAIATAATMILWNVTLLFLVRKRLGVGVGLLAIAVQLARGESLWK